MSSSSSNPKVRNILDIPDEILVKIISHFNARKRLTLAYSCKRFHSLVFEDRELLRDLDFSKNGRLTTPKDIFQYFGDKERRKHVRRVNFQNLKCMGPGVKMLNDSIGKAINLVDINVHGVEFQDIKELGNLLEPLIHVRRLSVDWPKSREDKAIDCQEVLQDRFHKLTYLSTKVYHTLRVFLSAVQICQQLEELRIVTILSNADEAETRSWILEPNTNRKLQIIQFRGRNSGCLRKPLISMLSDVHQWTELQGIDVLYEEGYYFEKNMEVCEKLRNTEWIRNIPRIVSEPGLVVNYKSLLSEVIKINYEDSPETFCCLARTSMEFEDQITIEDPCLLKIDEAKRLLKDPGYKISFLQLKHSIEPHCDAHLFTSAFKNLTELVLSFISKRDVSTWRSRYHFGRRLRLDGTPAPKKPDDPLNSESSFEMLVENTPHVRELSIVPRDSFGEWDLEALHLISRWKNLTALRLAYIDLKDGKFLINIAKLCPKLEILVLRALRRNSDDCFSSDLSQMLFHCRNLREFELNEGVFENLPEVFTSLANNVKLRRIELRTRSQGTFSTELMSSIEGLLNSCKKLTTFVCITDWIHRKDSNQLESTLQRLKSELNRPKLQFQLHDDYISTEPATVHTDATTSFFSCKAKWPH